MDPVVGNGLVNSIQAALKAGRAIDYGQTPDPRYAEVLWQTVALQADQGPRELAVIVSVGQRAYAAKAEAPIQYGLSVSRAFGINALEEALAQELQSQLWNEHGWRLVQPAHENPPAAASGSLSDLTAPLMPLHGFPYIAG